MPKFRMTLAYDGTLYRGWQLQPGADTIQGRVESALGRMAGEEVRVTAAGRTDSGVHAWAQTAHFRLPRPIPPQGTLRGLNAMLPDDIRVVEVSEAPEDFHARFDAVSKTYRYYIDRSEVPSPLRVRFALSYPHPLRRESLEDAAARIQGEHDFAGFRASSCRARTTLRRVSCSKFLDEGDELVYEISATGFLHHMVRNLMGTLLEVGRGKRCPESIEAVFASGRREEAGPTAPAKGLHLVRVDYGR